MTIGFIVFIAAHAFGQGAVIWVFISEIFPNKVRGAAMAVATFALWTGNALLAYFFPIINSRVNASGSFWIFALICVAGFFYIKAMLIETRGKSLEEIENSLIKKQKP